MVTYTLCSAIINPRCKCKYIAHLRDVLHTPFDTVVGIDFCDKEASQASDMSQRHYMTVEGDT